MRVCVCVHKSALVRACLCACVCANVSASTRLFWRDRKDSHAVCYSVFECVAVLRNVLQCVAVCCSVSI